MSETDVPAGWYDDGSGTRRWWDGTRWTEHTQGTAAARPEPFETPTSPEPADPGGSYRAPAERPDPSAATAPAGPTDGGVGSSYEAMGYGYPADGAPEPVRRRRLWFVVGGVVGLVVVLALVLVFTLGGGGGAKPEATVTRAFDALGSGDCDAFRSTLAPGDLRDDFTCEVFEQASRLSGDADLDVVSSTTDGDRAEVVADLSATVAGLSRTQRCTYELDRQDGDWLIDSLDCS